MATATTRTEVYDFETHLEKGIRDYFSAASLLAYIRTYLFDPESPPPENRLEVEAQIGQADPNTMNADADGILYYRDYQFTINIRIQVALDDPDQPTAFDSIITHLGEFRARARALLEQERLTAAWTESISPYLTIAHIFHQGTIRDTYRDDMMDSLDMQYQGVFGIRPDAIPAS